MKTEIKRNWIVTDKGDFGVSTIKKTKDKTFYSFLSVRNLLRCKEKRVTDKIKELEKTNEQLKEEINKIKSKFNIDFNQEIENL